MTPAEILTERVLVLGGARSGKSAWAERRLGSSIDVDYLATSFSDPDDAEWQARVRAHRERRPATWTTIETLDVAAELTRPTHRALLIDCLTLWLTRTMDAVDAWSDAPGWADALHDRTAALVAAFGQATRPVIAVSNEVGQGIVPADAASRAFRDEMGRLNAQVAAAVDQVWFTTAGIPTRIK